MEDTTQTSCSEIRETEHQVPPDSSSSINKTVTSVDVPDHPDNRWGDYEDDTYDDWPTDQRSEDLDDTEGDIQESKRSEDGDVIPDIESDNDHVHSVLVHRYDHEVQRMYNLKTQSVFILTALGFLISIFVGILSANWFSFSNFREQYMGLIIALLITLIIFAAICAKNAWMVLSKIDGNNKKNDTDYWDYPDNETLNLCLDSSPEIYVNKRVLCRTLAYTITHNYKNNQEVQILLNKALRYLFLTIFYSFIIIVVVIIISYFASPDNAIIVTDNVTILSKR